MAYCSAMDLADSISAARPLVLAGAGKMGSALLSGWLSGGLPPSAVRVIDPSPSAESRQMLEGARIAATADVPKVTASVLALAVKPQMIAEVMPALKGAIDRRSIVLSIAAGTKLATIISGLGTDRVIRAMPNTPAQIGMGISVAVGGAGIDESARRLGTALLEAVGEVEWIDDESLMDAVTAVSGSGPAYVFLLAECLAEAGVEAGLSADLARRLADATVSGAGALLAASSESPAQLRKNVTSPGGTTAAALDVLMAQGGLSALMQKAVAAAKKRAGELG
jgi:pyrroline-5-carboxylate reductase